MYKLQDVKCQQDHLNKQGCGVCGGYGIVLAVRYCPTCNHACLVRPGSYTSYDGKLWRSADGVEIIDHFKKPATCSFCPKGDL